MSAKHGGRSRLDQYELYGPWGSNGNSAGECAIGVLAVLSESVPDSWQADGELIVWSTNDSDVFEDLMVMETTIRFIDPHPDVDGGDVGNLHRAFARFHTALPLTEAERHWLFDPIDREQPRIVDMHEPETLLGVAEEIIAGGMRQVIQGEEVLRRLAVWRRETDEFAHQGTLNVAREALREIATTLVTEANWPQEHEILRPRP